MFEELFHLLSQLGLASAARSLYDLLLDLTGESMSVQQLHQEIRNVLNRHGGAHCAEAVVLALVELGYAGLVEPEAPEGELTGIGTGNAAVTRGGMPFHAAAMLTGDGYIIVTQPDGGHATHHTAQGWLDIDGGIYVDVGQHGAGTDPET